MKTVRYTKEDLKKVAEELRNGKIIAFPTDTVFGLGCIYDNEDAKNAIMAAKGRDEKKALPMMCTKELIETVATVNDKEKKAIETFMPGAITIIFKKKNLPDFVTCGMDTVAIRVPDDEWIIELIKTVGKPLLVTSANLSDKGSLLKYEDVIADMDERIDGIVKEDARGEKASTIVALYDKTSVLREGPISKERIFEVLGE